MLHIILTYRWLVKEIVKSLKAFQGLHKKKEKHEFKGVIVSSDEKLACNDQVYK